MNSKIKTLGLRQQMAQAKTEADLQRCINIVTTWQHMSPHTIRRWKNTIARRQKELSHGK